jgi:chromosome segregation ATPase
MIGTKRKKDATKEQIRQLFAAADEARTAYRNGVEKVSRIEKHLEILEKGLPSARQRLQDAEHRKHLLEVSVETYDPPSQVDLEAAAAEVEAGRKELVDMEGKALAAETLLGEARAAIPRLQRVSGDAPAEAWKAVSEDLEPAAREALRRVHEYYVTESLSGCLGLTPEMFLLKFICLPAPGEIGTIARELESRYRNTSG